VKRGKNKGKKNTIIHAFLRAEGVTKLNFAENSKELLEEAHFERRNCPPLPLPVDLPSITSLYVYWLSINFLLFSPTIIQRVRGSQSNHDTAQGLPNVVINHCARANSVQ